ncbi:hypothetical protein RUE5091_04546 [Ruegeria denitrificans]|uniref:Uncharacterized protein n=2 Tax=Ruegeria denitrificans TaxID=1715692 RepID=A0A0P1IRA1_9RHOB|nr:hypothetical protein RUE5091_04546 [Ruegeria denitrificans]
MRWLYPEPADFLSHFPRVMDFFGGRAFEQGSAFRNDDFTAGIWLLLRSIQFAKEKGWGQRWLNAASNVVMKMEDLLT